ncbi:EamA family transporter, partial [Pseudomonas aeruginosa]|nr:EamA family transporter [Pseudomonas aeruginosa]
MPDRRTLLLTVLALLAFAGNSLLCRAALKDTAIDAVSFTALRLFSGALMPVSYTHLRAHETL